MTGKGSGESERKVWFGNAMVSAQQKVASVAQVFDKVAPHYNCMNDILSLGTHRGWKSLFVAHLPLFPGDKVLDLATGTGDLCAPILSRIGDSGMLYATDINHNMLANAERKAIADGWLRRNVRLGLADAMQLPFADNSIDVITISFGLRNTADLSATMREARRVLAPHGTFAILEFSSPVAAWFEPVYAAYSKHLIPALGSLVGRSRASYQYLVDSIARHPDRFQLAAMLEEAGFHKVEAQPISGGIVAIHTGVKPPQPYKKLRQILA